MFTFKQEGRPVAFVHEGKKKAVLSIKTEPSDESPMYFREIQLDNGFLMYHPECMPNQTDRICVSSGSGSGKSVWVNTYITNFYKCHPDAPETILFTRQTDDNSDIAYLDNKHRMKHIYIDESLVTDPVQLADLCTKNEYEEYNPTLIIFDDYTDLPRKIEHEVIRLRNEIASHGRKLNLYLIMCSTYLPVTNSDFRNLLVNCDKIVIFPSRAPSNISGVLERYYNVGKKTWSMVKNEVKSRWILFSRNDIPFILWETGAICVDADSLEQKAKEKERIAKELLKKTIINI